MARSIKNLIAAILIAISGYLLITEVWSSRAVIDYLKNSIEEKTVVVASRNEILEKIAKLRKERDEKYAEFQRLALILPEKDNLPEIITAVESIFSQSGVVLPSITLGRAKGVEQVRNITFEIGSTATYSQLLSLLYSLEKNIRIFDVTDVSVGLDKKDREAQLASGDLILMFMIKGNFYVLNQE